MGIWGKTQSWICGMLLCSASAYAQDPHFSQQYATRLYLNPAFTGLVAEAAATAAYRNQWPSLSGSFVTNYLSGEMRFGDSKSSAGFYLLHDKAGSSAFTQFEAAGIYSYHTRITKDFAVSAGLQAMYGSRKVDFNGLIFGDQLTDDGLQNATTAEINAFDPARYVSFGTGGVLFSNQFWLSVATQHLNQPDVGYITASKLPFKMVLNSGYKFYAHSYLSRNELHEFSFTPTITHTRQGPFNKTDLGLYTNYSPVTVGILYRGLPIGTKTEQSIVLATGVQIKAFKMAYSYDIGLSGISAASGGAHEITLTFENAELTKIFRKRYDPNKNYVQIACPAF